MLNSRTIYIALLLTLFAAGCMPVQSQIVNDGPQTISSVEDESMVEDSPSITSTPLPTSTPAPTATIAWPTPTVTPSVQLNAVNGNLYIRRGPETAYNSVGILMNGTSAQVVGQDVLSKWVQIIIPETDQTGWVSLLTPYSKINGDLSQVPAFTFTEWPEPAYIKNCTEHDIIIMPNELYLYSLWTNSTYMNFSQIDPGYYEIRDATLPDEPLIEKMDIREGDEIYITVNGLGEKHNCPENN